MDKEKRYKQLKELTTKRNKLVEKLGKINKDILYLFPKEIPLKEALKREYEIKTCKSSKDRIACRIYLPICLSGKKVKLKLVKE